MVRYLFEDCVLDTDRRELTSALDLVPVEPQVFDLLAYLIDHRERVVSKDELLNAIWKGRIVSESSLTTRINAARCAIGDSGVQQRIIKTVIRKGFRFIATVRQEQLVARSPARPADKPDLELPNRPSIAVLPFINMSGDADQEYFADGIVEEIITALSQLRWLFVIDPRSSFTYKGRSVEVKQVGHDLGVRYVLEGSIRKTVNRVRIAAQLIDASNATNLWATRFEGTLEDVFDLQDRVTASVVGSIAPQLEQAEIERAKRKPTESLDAYDHYLQGLANVHLWTKEANEEALRFFYRAIELDHSFAAAHGMAARCYSQRQVSGWVTDGKREKAETERLARRAAELGRNIPLALSTAGLGLAGVVGKIDEGAALIARSLDLNPNWAWAWLFNGWVKILAGEPEAAIAHIERAMRLSPQDPHIFNMQGLTAWAFFFAGRDAEASSWAATAIRHHPNYLLGYVIHAASKVHLGQLNEARQGMVRLRKLAPLLRVSNLTDLAPLSRSEDRARLADALRTAGLPE
jgi:TolB-like protein